MLCALLTGCAAAKVVVVNGIEVYEDVWTRTSNEIRPRATAELNCPETTLTLVRRIDAEPVEVLAIGCGRRGMYVKPMSKVGGYKVVGSWQLTTMTTDSSSEQPAPAAGTKALESI